MTGVELLVPRAVALVRVLTAGQEVTLTPRAAVEALESGRADLPDDVTVQELRVLEIEILSGERESIESLRADGAWPYDANTSPLSWR